MIKAIRRVSNTALFLLALISLGTVYFASHANRLNQWYKMKIRAAEIMLEAERVIAKERLSSEIGIYTAEESKSMALIGEKDSPITTDKGYLDLKKMATNPNFASVVVDMIKEARLRPGDLVTVGYTGSFPGANIAVLSAIQAVGLEPIIISSVGSSNWGANDPYFTWLDMESVLYNKGIIKFRSVAASLGGLQDRAKNLSPEGVALLEEAIKRNGVEYIKTDSRNASVYKRLEIYGRFAQEKGKKIKLYINVGGGHANLGSDINYMRIPSGLSSSSTFNKLRGNGTLFKMAAEGIPVIHLLKLREIALDYKLPLQPPENPVIGQGKVFLEEKYSSSVAALSLIFLIAVIFSGLTVDCVLIPRIKQRNNG